VFLFANLAQRTGQLGVLALLVAVAAPSEVTWFGLFGSFFLVVVPLSTWNVHLSIGRLWFTVSQREGQVQLASTLLVTGLALGIVGTLLAIGVLAARPDLLEPSGLFTRISPLMLLGSVAYVVATYTHALLRATDRVRGFFWFSLALSLGYPLAFLAAGPWTGFGFMAAAISFVVAYGLSGAVGVFALRDLLTSRRAGWRPALLRSAFAFGSGTAIFSLTQWVINCAGRWIGALHLDATELAGYTLVTQVYGVVGGLISVFFETYRVVVLKKFASGDEARAIHLLWRPTLQALGAITLLHVLVAPLVPWLPRWLGNAYDLELTWIGLSWLVSAGGVFLVRTMWIAECYFVTRRFAVIAVLCSLLILTTSLTWSRRLGVAGLLLAPVVGVWVQLLLTSWMLRREAKRRAGHIRRGLDRA